MSKLALPPLNALPNDAQAAFRAIAAWANSLSESSSRETIIRQVATTQSASTSESTKIAERAAARVVSRRTGDILRDVLQNSGTQPAIEMNAPVLFKASRVVDNREHAVFIGAGGVAGAYIDAGGPLVTTFSVSADDGSFSFGAEDSANTSDPSHRQIVFDSVNNVITFGSDIVIQRSSGSTITLDELANSSAPYSKTELEADLASGVGTVLAGIGGDYLLTASAEDGIVILKHKDVQYGYSAGGAGYSGNYRTAIAITANGIAMGYNDKSTGNWVSSIAIDATTGTASFSGAINATSGNFTGTVNAGSIISGSATVSGTSMSSIRSWSASAVQPAAIANFIDRTASTTLSGTISPASGTANAGAFKIGTINWSSTGALTGGTGIAITANGIIGANSGNLTFAIDSDGNAIFKGDILTNGSIHAYGESVQIVDGTTIRASITAAGGVNGYGAIYGYMPSTYTLSRSAITGHSEGTNSSSAGVSGRGYAGVRGQCLKSGGYGVYADRNGTVGAYALYSNGKFGVSDSTMVTNLNANYLNGKQSSDFLLTTGTAANSTQLGGSGSEKFLRYTDTILAQTATVNGRTASWAAVNVNGVTAYVLISLA